VDFVKVKKEVEARMMALPPADLSHKSLPFTPRAKKVVELAITALVL
jgi:hypothetical protein